MKPNQGKPKTDPPEPAADWPESVLPGDRSGEGSDDLFKHVERDIQRRAGVPRKQPPDKNTN